VHQQRCKIEKAILKIQGLRIENLAGEVLVDNANIELMPGEILGLIGESGAGKSTIGLASMSYARAGCKITSGHIEIDGVQVRNLSAKGRAQLRGRRIAYVAQSAAASFNPAHSIMDQICEMPVHHGVLTYAEAEAWAVEMFHTLELPDPDNFGARYPHQVSGGQLQRAMVIMAISAHPDIVVFDEPTTALDVTTQIEVLLLIKKMIHDYNIAALYITHDLAVVAQIADRILVLQSGKMVELDTTANILHTPKETYTKELVEDRQISDVFRKKLLKSEREVILEASNIIAHYGDFRVLNDVSMTVAKGETLAIVGESGSGKTSLARVMVGLTPPTSGDMIFMGHTLAHSIKNRSRDDLRKIQLIYQQPDVALNPRQTVGEIISRPIIFYFNRSEYEIKDRTAQLLNQVGLPEDYINRYSNSLSGGQKQRVCIARALAAEPKLIICDEPTSALDQLVAEDILKLLQQLQDDLDLSYLVITHDLGIVRRVAHRTVVFLGGEVVANGLTGDIFKPPFHSYTEKLLQSVPELRETWLEEIIDKRSTQ
jgi:peptide/nickel transport system ATP-binding protein|tara:strand:- start:1157 stop:2785 length:1629 start_codon:yes stop_codon:yes gene_type:complete